MLLCMFSLFFVQPDLPYIAAFLCAVIVFCADCIAENGRIFGLFCLFFFLTGLANPDSALFFPAASYGLFRRKLYPAAAAGVLLFCIILFRAGWELTSTGSSFPGGGDFPRNVMCSPLSGVEQDECFDTLPWAEAAGEYLMTFIHAQKMPRKLKVAFSNSPKNITHATYRDLGFAARPDGKFDVYSAGGLGNNPRLGVLVAEAVEPSEILYYIKAMWLTFLAYGNYDSRAKARTRYMQEALGGPEAYAKAYQEKLDEVYASGEDLKLSITETPLTKQGDGSTAEGFRVIPQKQEGLYSVLYHPIGGQPPITWFASIYGLIQDMQDVELRLSPDETIYIINLTGAEAQAVLKATEGGAETLFETSVSCIGGTTCQVGPRDSQGLLAACIKAVREAELPADALPQIHISGCTSSCGTHQTGAIGFNGTVKMIDKVAHPAFFLHVNGREGQADACIGTQLGAILETDIPSFLVELGRTVAESGLSFFAWRDANPGKLEELARKYIG